ncbi:MAG: PAS domain S-box protein [Deltaproteobacteria bacterium]|nr:PAS domain S-box protein [Deltaproteobacteria bacterium]
MKKNIVGSAISTMKNNYLLIGAGLSIVYWLFEASIHVYIFHEGSLRQQILSPDTHEIWMRLLAIALFIGFGSYAQHLSARRKRAEETTEQLNRELDQIFNTAVDGMRVIDKNFTIVRMNDTFSTYCGLSKNEAIGKKCYEVLRGPLCHTTDCPLTKVLGGADRIECDTEKERQDGKKIPFILMAAPFRGIDGQLLGIIEDFKDITQRRNNENELAKYRSHLEELIKERTSELHSVNAQLQQKIKEYQRAEKMALEQKERLRIAAENASDVIYEWDIITGNVKWFNGIDELLGYEPGELPGTIEGLNKRIHREDYDRVSAAIDLHLTTGEPYFQEFRLVRKDGSFLYWKNSGQAMRDEEGKPYLWIGVGSDITASKEMEKALRESEIFFKSLFEDARDALFIADPASGLILKANREAETLLSRPREEIIGLHITGLHPPDTVEAALRDFKKSIQQENMAQPKYLDILVSDGRRVPVEITTSVIKTAEGRKLIQAVFRNITERKRADESLAWESAVNEAMADLSGALISLATMEEISTLILEYARKLTKSTLGLAGYIDEKTGYLVCPSLLSDVGEMCRVKDKKNVFKKFGGLWGWVLTNRKSLLTNAPAKDPRTTGLPEGHVPIRNFISAPALITGTLVGQISLANSERDYSARDLEFIERLAAVYAIIIQRRRANEEQEKMQLQLLDVQKMEAVGTLAGGIAHDFNNLLAAILGNLSLIKVYTKKGDKVLEVLQEAEKASKQAKGLTQQLLTFSQGGAPVRKTASLVQLLKDVVLFALSGSKVKCALSLPEDLWSVEIDEGQINQVLNNVIINADQAMAKGGTITLSAENTIIKREDELPLKRGNYVKILIKDQGMGIPEENLAKIFNPYFTTKTKGTGLGLSISYSIIKKHEGYIAAESSSGEGTTFTIYLPASEKEQFMVADMEEHLLSGRGRILFMDDQPSLRNMIGHMLTYLGYEVELVDDGAKAVALYKKARQTTHPFEAVILDLTVPGAMGGLEAMKELLKIDPEVKAIVSSGYSNDPIMGEYAQYGFSGVIAKPFQIEELSKIISQVVEGIKGIKGEKEIV